MTEYLYKVGLFCSSEGTKFWIDALKSKNAFEYSVVEINSLDSSTPPEIDLVINEIDLPYIEGMDSLKKLRHAFHNTKIITYFKGRNYTLLGKLINLGANGILVEGSHISEAGHAIGEVIHGKTYVSPAYKNWITYKSNTTIEFSMDEVKLIEMVYYGKTSKEIANLFCLSPRTIENKKQQIMERLDCKNMNRIIYQAIKMGFIDPFKEAYV